jgi:hypothetical protein
MDTESTQFHCVFINCRITAKVRYCFLKILIAGKTFCCQNKVDQYLSGAWLWLSPPLYTRFSSSFCYTVCPKVPEFWCIKLTSDLTNQKNSLFWTAPCDNILSWFMCEWLSMGYGLVNAFTDHLYTPLRTTVITALLLISTRYKSLQHLLSLFPACCVFSSHSWQWLLTVEILQLHMPRVLSAQLPVQNSQLSTNS